MPIFDGALAGGADDIDMGGSLSRLLGMGLDPGAVLPRRPNDLWLAPAGQDYGSG